ncbi:TetR/AcrR family transcriptional regulator [Novosphingobium pentaromativorans]|nr:TetR/AcrR family transcriptional regulator [Novosphingobium pentaromativorans]
MTSRTSKPTKLSIDTPRKGRRRPTISEGSATTADEILDVTIRLIAAKGLSNVRIIDVAEKLGVWPRTIYHYIESKDRLIALAVERIFETTSPPQDLNTPWKAALKERILNGKRTFLKYPGLLEYFTKRNTLFFSRGVASNFEYMKDLFSKGGIDGEDFRFAFSLVNSFIQGQVYIAESRMSIERDAPPNVSVDPADFPVASSWRPPSEEESDLHLDRLLDMIENLPHHGTHKLRDEAGGELDRVLAEYDSRLIDPAQLSQLIRASLAIGMEEALERLAPA